MNFRELRYITAIAEYQNITRAAQSLSIHQPGLSKLLARVEEDLGFKLFSRIDKKYIPTREGEVYLSHARTMLELKEALDSEMSDIRNNNIGVLNIGMSEMRSSYMLPKMLPIFNRKYPNVKINAFDETSTMINKRLLEGDIDIAFLSKPQEPNNFIMCETLAHEELLVCTCRNHHVKTSAKNGHIELSSLSGERLILLSPEQRTGQISRYWLKRAGLDLSNSITTNNMPAVISLTEQGWGVSFVFESHLRWHLPTPEIDTYSFGDGHVMSDFVAAYRRGSYLSSYAREFISIAGKLYA